MYAIAILKNTTGGISHRNIVFAQLLVHLASTGFSVKVYLGTMSKDDEDYKQQVEEANQTLIDGLEAQQKVADRGDDIEEYSWEPFLNQLKGLVADGELLDETRTDVEGFRDTLLAHSSVLLQSRGKELEDTLNTPTRDD
ncbi:uncharacterized protein F4822DRAFT_440623 [Hypoxylon trugodes]|uniref:uncharacterized protein n=1 Tax=Hypoxylon trugodes TaxID=326681 RepID=UPI00219E99D3|nr:uncharacterized protein F4822DRAFT_440623 [Hypoxylon trugodes]KAI1383615.1 hypothetical protein F4822DRAFT_440623 [Hypoxylon trugodes]